MYLLTLTQKEIAKRKLEEGIKKVVLAIRPEENLLYLKEILPITKQLIKNYTNEMNNKEV